MWKLLPNFFTDFDSCHDGLFGFFVKIWGGQFPASIPVHHKQVVRDKSWILNYGKSQHIR